MICYFCKKGSLASISRVPNHYVNCKECFLQGLFSYTEYGDDGSLYYADIGINYYWIRLYFYSMKTGVYHRENYYQPLFYNDGILEITSNNIRDWLDRVLKLQAFI
jgi:hypothetical protein